MKSKEIFTEKDREIWNILQKNNELNLMESKCFNALQMAESEIELLREKLHNANVEISSLIDLRPEN
jgi:hypothetical protein